MKYKVGKRTFPFVDPKRAHWSKKGPRPLRTELWYPAAEETQQATFFIAEQKPLFKFDPIAIDADMHPGPASFPLIVLSHGTGGSALQMGWLARSLAEHGFIAAAVNHHGNNTLEPYLVQGFSLWWERAKDLTHVIDCLLNDVVMLKDKIDTSRIGVAGFSLGGCSAVIVLGGRCNLDHFDAFCASSERDSICDGPQEFPGLGKAITSLKQTNPDFRDSLASHGDSYQDPRVKAAFIMAPALAMAFSDSDLAKIDKPVHVVVPPNDNAVPPKTNGHRFAEHIPGASLDVLQCPADHYVFLCEATTLGRQLYPQYCVDTETVSRRDIHQNVSQQAVQFFENQLVNTRSSEP